jgi:hypothetical protein
MDLVSVVLTSGVVAALVSIAADWWRDKQDRARRRKAAATALLYELRIMDLCLREMYDLEHPANQFAGPTFPMYEAIRGDLLLFKATMVEAVLTAWGYMQDIRHLLEAFEQGIAERERRWDDELRWLARCGIEAIPAARTALLAEGGQPPAQKVSTAQFPMPRQPLSPSPFANGAA